MDRFTRRLRFAAALAGFGLVAAAAAFLVYGPGAATGAVAAGGLFTIALAVVVRD